MEQKSGLREFLWYASLNVLGMLGLSCYILADTFFVSKGLGADGLTALNLAIPVYSFVHGTGLMLGMGGGTKYAICRGQGAVEEGNRVFRGAVTLAAGFALFYFAAGVFLAEKLTALLGADEAVFSMTCTYLRVILLFAPAFIANDVLLCFVRNDGNPRLAMMGMLGGSLSNVVLDYIFIFPLGMGILGAVLATGMAPLIGMSFLSFHFIKGKNHFSLRKAKRPQGLAGTILSLGFPSLITEVSSGLVIIVFNILILGLRGNTGVAAYGVIANLSLVVLSIYTGIAQGVQPLLSRAYGYGRRSAIWQNFFYAVGAVCLLSLLIYPVVALFADPIAAVFNSEGNRSLQEMAVYGMRLYFTAIPFAGFNIILSVFFTSTERALPAHAVSLLRGLILIVPAAILLAGLGGLTGVWLAFPVTETLVSGLGIILLLIGRRREKKSLA